MFILGYSDTVKGYRLIDTIKNKILTSRDSKYRELSFSWRKNDSLEHEISDSVGVSGLVQYPDMQDDSFQVEQSGDEDEYIPNEVVNACSKSRKSEQVPKPKPDKSQWAAAMQEELQSFAHIEAWEVGKATGNDTVVKNKYDSKEFGKENEFPSEAGSSGAATFSDTSSTSFDTSQTKSTAGKSFNKPKATKSSGKERNNKDDKDWILNRFYR
ncbi:hypothetical protein WA026_015387 [Henosepilachna vigintioctopunctata]|uniref:Retroviral polymerase SH3-like domain-containing protein n=1 Tax=Henosepilachna vigintioctopunctata TaxID=420089 RepID=A0AAW1UJ67_9CUCU